VQINWNEDGEKSGAGHFGGQWNFAMGHFQTAQAGPYFNWAAVTHHERELPHDDFRRAHDNFRGAHYDHRRSHYGFIMMFVSRMSFPSAFRKNTSGGCEEADNTGK
jgi:hypothetical protein